MDSIIHADVFFFIATLGLLVFIVATIVVTCYIVTILHDARNIIRKVQRSTDTVTDTIENIASDVRDDGVIATIGGLFHRQKKKKSHINNK